MRAGTASKVVTAGTAAVAGAAVTAGAATGAKKRSAAAGVELWNSLAGSDDPTTLDGTVADSIKDRFGGDAEAQDGVKQAYSAYLQVCALETQHLPGRPLLGDGLFRGMCLVAHPRWLYIM